MAKGSAAMRVWAKSMPAPVAWAWHAAWARHPASGARLSQRAMTFQIMRATMT
jgi:hypothetical protein